MRALRASLSVAVLSSAILLFSVAGTAAPAAASTPTVVAWWSQLSAIPLLAADVPAGGMLLQGDSAAPIGVAGLIIGAPSDTHAGTVTLSLTVTGSSVLTAPPVACAAISSFTAMSDGTWAKRPSYSCARTIRARLDLTRKHLTFSLPRAGAWVLCAGAVLDRVVIEKPGSSSVVEVDTAESSPPASPSPAASSAGTATAHRGDADAPPAADVLIAPAAVPPVGRVTQPNNPVATPQLAPTQQTGTPALATTGSSQGGRRTWSTALGLAVLIALIVYWSDGFGALDVRRRTLSVTRGNVEGGDLDPKPHSATGAAE
jgi:hypothetical protein